MSLEIALGSVLLLNLIAANLPFISQRLFLLGPVSVQKHLGWRLLEWLVYGSLSAAYGYLIEGYLGQVYRQGWEFYVVLICLNLIFAFPGFVWRYLWLKDSEQVKVKLAS